MRILKGLIITLVVLVLMGMAIPILWPLATQSTDNITAMEGTDAGTNFFKSFWPLLVLLVAIGVVVGLIFYALRSSGLGGSIGGMAILPLFAIGEQWYIGGFLAGFAIGGFIGYAYRHIRMKFQATSQKLLG